jgi:predicted ATPase
MEFPVDQVPEFPNGWHVQGPETQRFKAFCGLMRYMRRVIDGVSDCHYLPAARSGFLSSHKLLAEAIVRRSPLVGLQAMEDSRLSGAIAEFVGNLLRLNPDQAKTSEPGFEIAGFLERELCGGRIEIAAGAAESSYPDIKYRSGEASYALQNCSSMVSEVAPIILYLKFQARKDDLLIIEEPESHLHPDNQRTLARAVVRMVRSGIRVLATTHSDYFVQQVSNLVMLGGRPDKREELGYEEDDCLDASDVGVYLFSMDDSGSGSTAEPLSCSAEEGIPEDEFGRIAEALYNEKVRLERAAMQV